MILVLLILNLLLGGGLAWLAGRWSASAARWTALVVTLFELLFVGLLWLRLEPAEGSPWLAGIVADWIPNFSVKLILLMDGVSLLLITLTAVLGVLAVLVSWREIQENVGFYYFNLLCVLAGVIGVFTALDLFLFYVCWELMLIPMFLLIANWGHAHRKAAAIKFFLFTQLSGLLMLVAILGLALTHFQATGAITFDYRALLGTAPGSLWLMLGFFVAFAVKLPAFPLHTWLPDAHTEAPTAGSLLLAGLLLKTGAYGLIRFILPLFPEAAAAFAPIAMTLGVIGILYGAVLAFAQTDFKRMVAYTSVSHLGFVLLAVFAMNLLALQGAVVQMLAHGFSTGALFVLAGALQERLHTRDLRRMGGLWTLMPRMGAVALFFAMAALGLPGLGNFVAEFHPARRVSGEHAAGGARRRRAGLRHDLRAVAAAARLLRTGGERRGAPRPAPARDAHLRGDDGGAALARAVPAAGAGRRRAGAAPRAGGVAARGGVRAGTPLSGTGAGECA